MSAAVYGNGIRRGVGIHDRADVGVYVIKNDVRARGADIGKREGSAYGVILVSNGRYRTVFKGHDTGGPDVKSAVLGVLFKGKGMTAKIKGKLFGYGDLRCRVGNDGHVAQKVDSRACARICNNGSKRRAFIVVFFTRAGYDLVNVSVSGGFGGIGKCRGGKNAAKDHKRYCNKQKLGDFFHFILLDQ